MLAHLFTGFQVLHGVLFALAAVGFFIFWARTRFWLPQYAHILAAIGLAVGIWCVSSVTDDAPINKARPGCQNSGGADTASHGLFLLRVLRRAIGSLQAQIKKCH